jgi:hypothetical protein
MDIILSLVIISILAFAIRKIYTDKKKGSKCSSCPYASVCSIRTESKLNNQCELNESMNDTVITNS